MSGSKQAHLAFLVLLFCPNDRDLRKGIVQMAAQCRGYVYFIVDCVFAPCDISSRGSGARIPPLMASTTSIPATTAPKRKLSPLDETPHAEPPTKKRAIDSERRLELPSLSTPPKSNPPFQQPQQLTSFSYTPERVQVFDDSALRYFISPPENANLNHRYDHWIKRPEERGRLDGLLKACTRPEVAPECSRANFVTWRGVMTKSVFWRCICSESSS